MSAAAIAGGLILGPVGVLLGTGALACAAGYHSLPEEQRQKLMEDTSHTWKRTYEWGERMSDKLGASCAIAFEKTGEVVGVGCDTREKNNKTGSSTRFGVLLTPTALSSQFRNGVMDGEAPEEMMRTGSGEEQAGMHGHDSHSSVIHGSEKTDLTRRTDIGKSVKGGSGPGSVSQRQFQHNQSMTQPVSSSRRGEYTPVFFRGC